MSLPLIDTSEEDIACVLYDAFDFMLGNEQGGRNDDDDEEEEEEEEEKKKKKEGLVSCIVKWAARVRLQFASRLSCGKKACLTRRLKECRRKSDFSTKHGFVKTLEAWHEERTNRSSSSSSGSDVISYRIVEHENRKGYVVPKRETPSSFAAANNTPFSPKDDPNAVVLRFKSEACDDVLPTLLVGDRVDRDTDPRVDKRALDKITEQILFYEYGVCKHARRRLRRRRR